MNPHPAETERTSHAGAAPVAVFWDQSLVWGVICRTTLQALGIPFHLLTGTEIAQGKLQHYRVLVVPGGWASHKMRALGRTGQDEIRRFVDRGGSYLGFCGGAGLALTSAGSLGLVKLERLPLSSRLPSASGQVLIRRCTDHPIWRDLPDTLPVSIWWPSQFHWKPQPELSCLAGYKAIGKDFRVADLPISDSEGSGICWEEWEEVYGINLNPKHLLGQPAIVEGCTGHGRLILSYPHLETPEDIQANQLLANIVGYLDQAAASRCPVQAEFSPYCQQPTAPPSKPSLQYLEQAVNCVDDLIGFGERHLLWNWRLPWLLHWRRSIRGLEYGTLAVLVKVLYQETRLTAVELPETHQDPWTAATSELTEKVQAFCAKAKRLLLEERLAAQKGHFSKVGRVNDSVDQLRHWLFGREMSHGGLCRDIFDRLDHLLYQAFTQGDQMLNRTSITSPSCTG